MLPSHFVEIIESIIQSYCATELQQAYQLMQNTYRKRQADSKLVNSLSTDLQQLAYLSVRLPATFSVCDTILNQLSPYADHIETVFDLGCGPGTASFAALNQLSLIKKVTLVDQTLGFRNFINRAMQNYTVEYLLIREQLPWRSIPDQQSDLTLMSYTLNELNEKDQNKLVEQAWNLSQKFLVIIEPGTVIGSNNILRARDILINQGAYIMAPCPHTRSCPLEKPDWCHFSCRLPRTKIHQKIKAATLSYEDEKYSYLIATKNFISTTVGRIIKKPIINKGHVLLDICCKSGIERTCISKKQSNYRAARHSEWGQDTRFFLNEDKE